jgi:hypothetical protein
VLVHGLVNQNLLENGYVNYNVLEVGPRNQNCHVLIHLVGPYQRRMGCVRSPQMLLGGDLLRHMWTIPMTNYECFSGCAHLFLCFVKINVLEVCFQCF